ncbi:WhiB family transcriptional regulator [Nocardiopsis ansamitocini]|uniref:Transcriptional regulator WhiB n=1 Tax=Nocardiopsis ansamitocini TaxID=1670832 RepID=A0A9W6P3A9_9ACTN|nr:WhiB family transcriptional regulator [Nocardiopsis ansamitocini]GLU46311.1 transcriptional regulator WhiB [Nocardiopsis ansamitocini]
MPPGSGGDPPAYPDTDKENVLNRTDPTPGRAWMTQGLCGRLADNRAWFPDRETPAQTAAAREVCARCPVSASCLAYALDLSSPPRGVWAATTTNQRKDLRARHRFPLTP